MQSLRRGNGNGQGQEAGLGSVGPSGGANTDSGAALGPSGGLANSAASGQGAAQQGLTGGGAAVGAAAPPGGNGGATDVGVTGNTITVGLATDISGPQPGLFQGVATAAQAYAAYVNSQGGIYGRQLKINVADSQTDCQATQNAYSSLAPKVFAYAGGFSLYDDCAAQVLGQHPEIPSVTFALSPQYEKLPNVYNFLPTIPGAQLGFLQWYKQQFPNAPKSVGALYSSVPAATAQWHALKAAMQSVGYNIVYERAVAPTESNFTADVIRMAHSNPSVGFVESYLSGQQNSTLVSESQQQNFRPDVINGPGTMYDPSFAKQVGSGPSDVFDNLTTAPWFNASAAAIPGVGAYQRWMKVIDANQPLDEYSTFGWIDTALFVQALKVAGPRATRPGLFSALKGIHDFTADGFTPAVDVGNKKPINCDAIVHYTNGSWSQVSPPGGGFDCSYPYFLYNGS
jgi:ABC-type branched-subunit amino acid transport system substrate-binding protein